MYLFILIPLLIFLLTSLAGGVYGTYNRSKLMELHPELGKDFVIFPNDEENKVKVGYLNAKPTSSRLFGFGSTVEKAVTFTLYNRCALDGILLEDFTDLPVEFDKTGRTIFITHGWLSHGKKNTCVKIKDAYLDVADVNVFIIDWGPIADNIFYVVPMGKVVEIGKYCAKFLNFLVNDHNINPKNFHLIGHSLGAHVCGAAGREVTKGKVGRITGLDPALPGFGEGMFNLAPAPLNKSDAAFVDVIHTCAGFLGYETPLGHADFYPNNGRPSQPGCSFLDVAEVCSHGRSWRLFVQTILSKKHFMATGCDSLEMVRKKECYRGRVPMGEPTPSNTVGIFYIETTGKEPFIKL